MTVEDRLLRYLKVEGVPNTRGGMQLVLRHKKLAIKVGSSASGNSYGRPYRFEQSRKTAAAILSAILEDMRKEDVLAALERAAS